MSIKTTKRIALGVIASLVFAPFAALAPASASAVNFAATPSLSASTATAIVGSTNAIDLNLASDTLLDGVHADTLKATVAISVPAGSSVSLTDNNGAGNGTTAVFADTAKAAVFATSAISSGVVTATSNTAATTLAANTAAKAGVLTVIPDAPGTYIITVTGRNAADTANTVAVTYTLTVRSLAYTTGDGAAATPFSTGGGVAGPANTVTITGHATQSTGQRALVTVSGAGATIQSGSNSPAIATNQLSAVITAASSSALVIRTPEVGTVTVSLFNETGNATGFYSTTAANTVTITVRAAAITDVYSSSTVWMNTASTTPTSASDATTTTTAPLAAASATAGTPIANILVRQLDAQGTPALVSTANTKAVVYEISGAGALGTSGSASIGAYIAVAAGSANSNIVYIHPDGRAGVGTITVRVDGVLVATKTVRFHGAVASYTLTTTNAIIAAGDSADTQVLTVRALDANGVAVPNATVHVSSGTTSVATVDSATVTTGAAGEAADIGVNGIAAGTSVITVGNAASSPTVSATATITIAAAGISTVALAFDKTSYLPGERATITITLRNASAALVGDFAYTNVFAAGGIVPSSNLTTDMTATGVTSVNGVKTFTVFMPLIEGPVSVSATLGTGVATAAQGTTVTASTRVATPTVVVPEVFEKPTLSIAQKAGRIILSGTAEDGEGDIIVYVKRIGKTTWVERAKTFEVAAPGDFNGSIRAPKGDVVIRVKQEGTGLFSNQVIVLKP